MSKENYALQFDEKAQKVYSEVYGGGSGGVIKVDELPETGEEHTVYELHQEISADFHWLLTKFDTSGEYPGMGTYQALVVENEEDVTQEYLAMPNDFLEYNDNHCIVFVKNTGNVYDCNIEEGEIGPSLESPYVFIKSLLKLITDKTGNKYYEIGSKIWFIILSDFDYSVDNTGESTILNGIGHYLDGTVYDYATGSNYVVPLVLTKGTDKRIGLNLNLFGIVDLTNAPVQIPEEDLVTKIDLSILQKHFTEGPVFAPYSETHTEISYWYYSNDEWVNMDETQGGGTTLGIESNASGYGAASKNARPVSAFGVLVDDVELEIVQVGEFEPIVEDYAYTSYGYIKNYPLPTTESNVHTVTIFFKNLDPAAVHYCVIINGWEMAFNSQSQSVTVDLFNLSSIRIEYRPQEIGEGE